MNNEVKLDDIGSGHVMAYINDLQGVYAAGASRWPSVTAFACHATITARSRRRCCYPTSPKEII